MAGKPTFLRRLVHLGQGTHGDPLARRVTALAAKPVVANPYKLQSQSTSSNATSFVQKAAIAAVSGPQDCVAQFRAEFIELRDYMLAKLAEIPGITCTRPEGAFYVYPNISAFLDRQGARGGIRTATELATRLLHEAHVVAVPGEAFGTGEHIRISYPVTKQNSPMRRVPSSMFCLVTG